MKNTKQSKARLNQEVPLSDLLFELQSGARPKGGVRGISSGIISVGGEHLNDEGGFDWSNKKYVPVSFYKKMKRGHIKQNDVLIVKDGATTGKVSFVGSTFPYSEAVVNEHVFICRPNSKVIPEYLFHFLYSKEGQKRILEHFRGSAQGGINQSFADGTLIPFIPLETQRDIVRRVEAALPRVREAKERMEKARMILQRFRQAVLSAACSGTLISDSKEKFQEIALGDVGVWRSGGTPSKSKESFWLNGSIPWVSPKDMKRRYISDAQDHITEFALAKSGLRLLPENTILFVVRGMILAHTFPVGLTKNKVTINQDIKAILPNPEINPEYLLIALQNESAKILFEVRNSTHGTNRLETDTLKRWKIRVPSAKMQDEIVERVKSFFEIADRVEKAVTKTDCDCKLLMSSVLLSAFREGK